MNQGIEQNQVRDAAQALLNKLREIHKNPEYQEVWRTSQLHRGSYTGPAYGYQMAALDDALAARPVIHDTLCERLQQQCSDWGVYWRAPDAHGVKLTEAQAQELLERALGVEVDIVAPASALGNLEERARELLAVEFERDVPPFGKPQPDRAAQVRRGVWDHAPAHRALVAALTQDREKDQT